MLDANSAAVMGESVTWVVTVTGIWAYPGWEPSTTAIIVAEFNDRALLKVIRLNGPIVTSPLDMANTEPSVQPVDLFRNRTQHGCTVLGVTMRQSYPV